MSSIVKLFVICYIFGTVYLYSPSRQLSSSSSSVSNAICIVRVAPAQKPKIIFDSTAKICACGHWWRHRRRPPNDASSTSRNLKISHTHIQADSRSETETETRPRQCRENRLIYHSGSFLSSSVAIKRGPPKNKR